jgi:hypothetical protein
MSARHSSDDFPSRPLLFLVLAGLVVAVSLEGLEGALLSLSLLPQLGRFLDGAGAWWTSVAWSKAEVEGGGLERGNNFLTLPCHAGTGVLLGFCGLGI